MRLIKILAVFALIALGGCASQPQVYTDPGDSVPYTCDEWKTSHSGSGFTCHRKTTRDNPPASPSPQINIIGIEIDPRPSRVITRGRFDQRIHGGDRKYHYRGHRRMHYGIGGGIHSRFR